MRRVVSFLILVTVLAMIVGCKQTPEGNGAPPAMQGDALVSAKVAQGLPPTAESCMGLMGNSGRDRGWCLLSYLTAGGKEPIWTDWTAIPNGGVGQVNCGAGVSFLGLTSDQEKRLAPIVKAKPEMKVLLRLAPPVQGPRQKKAPKGTFQVEPLHDPTLEVFRQREPKSNAAAAVIYNDALKNAMCGMRKDVSLDTALSSSDAVKKLNSGNGVYIAVKTVWAVVPDSRPSPLPWFTVWDNQSPALVSARGMQDWGTKLQVDDSASVPDCAFVDLDLPQWPPGPIPKTISPKCFHSLSLNRQQLNTVIGSFPPNTTVQVNASGTAETTYLILMGFHVIAKIPGGAWTWQTFWWSAAATTSEKQFHQDSTMVRPGEWGNYVMMTEEEASADRSTFNPYLEAPLFRGGYSDCVTCHARARFYTTTDHSAKQLQNDFNAALHCALRRPNDTPCVAPPPGGLGTDSLWSLADSNLINLGHGDGGNSQ